MKTQVKLREIPVHKNVGKLKQNVDSRRLTLKLATLTCTRNSVTGKHGKRSGYIKNRYGRQVGSRISKKIYINRLEYGTI